MYLQLPKQTRVVYSRSPSSIDVPFYLTLGFTVEPQLFRLEMARGSDGHPVAVKICSYLSVSNEQVGAGNRHREGRRQASPVIPV